MTRSGERAIYKFPLTSFDEISDTAVLEMAAGPVVHAGRDPMGQLCLWALVDLDEPYVERAFMVRGTGMVVPDGASHLVTWTQGPFVWHMFELEQQRQTQTGEGHDQEEARG